MKTSPPSFGNPRRSAQKRIPLELKDWLQNPPEGCVLETKEPNPMHEWVILMQGPQAPSGMPKIYEGEVYRLSVRFTDEYPLEAPEVMFLPESPIHPHIYSNGHICLDILYDTGNGGWSPALTISKVCLSLRSMLASNSEKERPHGDLDYCRRVATNSPKLTRWAFDDDTV
ncbi:hypothetical protein BSKO_01364 [Bryopsis sp. KO-2023]|nr:hypothetical protein BSKO_01364 [Bryopsis sp. KO-2023]